MDDPYYSYAPILVTARPVALVGFIGAQIPLTGAVLATLTGLPYIDLERHVEHDAGCAISALVTTRGVDTLAAHERRVLTRTLREQLPPIIALGHATLTEARTRRLLTAHADIIYIQRPIAASYRALSRDASRCWPLGGRPPATPEVLSRLFEAHRSGYAAAGHTISAGSQHPHNIARTIFSHLSG
jgi:XRE family aerobic/anaerobic benzoate catabolism transcriptional regulator